MRLPALTLGGLLLLSACASSGDSDAPGGGASGDASGVLVDMDVGPGDLDALQTLLAEEAVGVRAVSLSLTSGLRCEDGAAAVSAVLADARHDDVPIACGPTEPIDGSVTAPSSREPAVALSDVEVDADADVSAVELGDLPDDVLGSVDQVVVLGPMTNVATLLPRLPEAPVTFAPGPKAGGAPANTAADPDAARDVVGQRTVTVIDHLAARDLAAEVVAAWLVIDESLGSFALEDVGVTSSGQLMPVVGGWTVRHLDSVDTERLATRREDDDQPVTEAVGGAPELRWRTDIDVQAEGFHKRATIVGDHVIVGGIRGQVHGISLATGELAWTVETGGDREATTGVAHEAGVAVLGREVQAGRVNGSELVAIDLDDRSVLWTFDPRTVVPPSALPDSVEVSSPAIADGVVYAGTGTGPPDDRATGGTIFALDLRTGELVWQADGFGGESEPTVAGDDLVVGGSDGTLRILDRHTGELRWQLDLVVALHGIASRPLVDEGVIYVTGDDGSVHALDQGSGEVIWRFQESTQPIPASPVLVDGRLIVAELFGGMTRALDPAKGVELWATRVGDVLGDPVVAGDTVVVGTFSGPGTVVGIDPASGETRWEFDNPDVIDGSLVVADDTLVYQAGDVYALDLPE